MLSKILPACLWVSALLFGEKVETFYGTLDVEEPILIELIHSPAVQRLKEINQYGVAYFTTHREKYTRYDHSIGVFAILLIKYGYTINQIYPKNKNFKRLEQPLPNLCADRIDYNLQGAYFQEFLTKEEVLELYNDLQFINGKWVGTRPDLLKKMALFPIFMTRDCWGSPTNYALSRWLADAIIKGLAMGILSWKEIHFGVDSSVWNKLSKAKDSYIQQRMHMMGNYHDYFRWTDPQDADILVKFRCRGIDPWVVYDGQVLRLSIIDSELSCELDSLRKQAAEGWPIKLCGENTENYFGS
jgi:hypothetical protein